MNFIQIMKNAYYDSVTLMRISGDVKIIDGVREALVGMGSDLNKEIAGNIGLDCPELSELTANDFFVTVNCDSEAIFENVKAKIQELLTKKAKGAAAEHFPATLDGAIKDIPELNMAVISVPGRFAADVAMDCLKKDINVLLFSDNVTVDEEKILKDYAASKELLMMGPDCGTAIINGVPLAFANLVRSGDIGLVCASGTGAQEVSTIIDKLGGGITELIGTGGRDLKRAIGAPMMKLALSALMDDPKTKVICLVSKPPEIEDEVLALAKKSEKPVVICFIGGDVEKIKSAGFYAAVSLEDAAYKAVALSKGQPVVDFTGFAMGEAAALELAKTESAKMKSEQKYVRGLYTGGTLCDEAMKMLSGDFSHLYSNIPLKAGDLLENAKAAKSREHTFLDFGDDEFTVGRPHPMIDPSLRAARVVEESSDDEVAVILLDCVIGYGSHENPAFDLSEAIKNAKKIVADSGGYLCVVASVCGTEADRGSLSNSTKLLTDAGAVVLPSNAQAARFVKLVLREGGKL